MSTKTHRMRRGLALAVVVSALAAPAASAAPAEQLGLGAPGGESQNQPYTPYTPPEFSPSPAPGAGFVADDGFDWGDAGIGAIALLALAAIGAGATVALGYRNTVA